MKNTEPDIPIDLIIDNASEISDLILKKFKNKNENLHDSIEIDGNYRTIDDKIYDYKIYIHGEKGDKGFTKDIIDFDYGNGLWIDEEYKPLILSYFRNKFIDEI